MLIVKFQGGLGNQMFQYAFYKSLSIKGGKVKADLSEYQYDKRAFQLNNVFPSVRIQETNCLARRFYLPSYRLRHFSPLYIEETNPGEFDTHIQRHKNGFLDGYWQSERYFKEIKSELLNDFQFLQPIPQEIQDKRIMMQKQESVSVHIRRGDYLEPVNAAIFGGICTLQYYQKALDYFRHYLNNPVFYFFSDDMDWVKANLIAENVLYMDNSELSPNYSWYDLFLMSQCKYNIIANSSFSWWGAWLNQTPEKKVVCPARWSNQDIFPDIFNEDWIKL